MTNLNEIENKEYKILRGIFSPTKDQLARLNELRAKMGQIETGFFKMSDADKDAAFRKEKDESAKRKADYERYRVSQKKIPSEKTYDPECPSFGEE